VRQKFERDIPAKDKVIGLVDDAHATTADLL
jgi:hypothetical protein